jgi:hypothetical protein
MGYGRAMVSSTRYEYLNGGLSYGLAPVPGTGAYGALATLGTTSFDYDGFKLYLNNLGQATRGRVTITANTGGSDQAIVSDIFVDYASVASVNWSPSLDLPIYVPRGSILKAKTWTNSNNPNVTLALSGYQQGARGITGFRGLLSASDFGATLDPTNRLTLAGTTTTGWVVAQAVTPVVFAGIYAFYDGLGNNHTAYMRFDIGIGPAGSEHMIGSFLGVVQGSGQPIMASFYCDIPAGARLVYRATCDRADTTVVALVLCGIAA